MDTRGIRTITLTDRGRATACLLGLLLFVLPLASPALAQDAKPKFAVGNKVSVPTSHANVHKSSSSGAEILLLVPKGTVLEVVGVDKEWVQVKLTPDMKTMKGAIQMRWYKNEDKGWMHDSTVEAAKDAPATK